jgi:dihydropteroate synthase
VRVHDVAETAQALSFVAALHPRTGGPAWR